MFYGPEMTAGQCIHILAGSNSRGDPQPPPPSLPEQGEAVEMEVEARAQPCLQATHAPGFISNMQVVQLLQNKNKIKNPSKALVFLPFTIKESHQRCAHSLSLIAVGDSSALEAANAISLRGQIQMFLVSSSTLLIPSNVRSSVADIQLLGCYSCCFLYDPAHMCCHTAKSSKTNTADRPAFMAVMFWIYQQMTPTRQRFEVWQKHPVLINC